MILHIGFGSSSDGEQGKVFGQKTVEMELEQGRNQFSVGQVSRTAKNYHMGLYRRVCHHIDPPDRSPHVVLKGFLMKYYTIAPWLKCE